MGFLSQGVPNLVPWLIFRAVEEGAVGIFDFGHFLGRFFGFCTEKLRIFGFDVRWSFWFSGFLASGFLAKIKHVIDFSVLWVCAVRCKAIFMFLFYSQYGSTVAIGDSGFLFEVYSSLCQALGQCRWAKKANEKRKRHDGKIEEQLPKSTDRRPTDFWGTLLQIYRLVPISDIWASTFDI